MNDIAERMEAILAECGQKLRTGEPLPIAEIVAANPDLPGLARLLARLPGLVPAHQSTGTYVQMDTSNAGGTSSIPSGHTVEGLPGIRLVSRIGRGGSGEVWLGYDLATGNKRAIKRLRPDRFSTAALNALREEARLLDSLPQHPGRVKVYGLFNTPDGPAIVLGFIDGGPLVELAPLPWLEAVRYIDQAAEALEGVHALGLKHGDITPANLLLDRSDGREQVVVTDFGLATRSTSGGTAGYTGPELLAGPVGQAGDVYGLAATLFYLLSKFSPFPAETLVGSLKAAARGLPAKIPELAGVPEGVVVALRRGLDPDPARRPTLGAFRTLLAQARLDAFVWDEIARAGLAKCPARLTATFTRLRAGKPEPGAVTCTAGGGSAPPGPPTLRIAAGDVLAVEVRADRPGYIAVLDLELGRESLFFPGPGEKGKVDAGQVVTVPSEMTPTRGEMIVVVWADKLGPADAAGWCRRLLAAGVVPAGRGGDTRAGTPLPNPDHWTAVAVSLDPIT